MTGERGMVERVARAICRAERMNPDDPLGGWLHWQDAARAAIAALREPTVRMMSRGDLAFCKAYGPSRMDRNESLGPVGTDNIKAAWHAAIDAALSDDGGRG